MLFVRTVYVCAGAMKQLTYHIHSSTNEHLQEAASYSSGEFDNVHLLCTYVIKLVCRVKTLRWKYVCQNARQSQIIPETKPRQFISHISARAAAAEDCFVSVEDINM